MDPLFSASKISWLLANIRDGAARASAGELCAGTVDSWLLWKLTGGTVHATDASNASRTQLLNLRRCEWDDELLRIFGISKACLPEVRPSSGIFGVTARFGKVPSGIPVASLIGDSHAALFGHAAFTPGAVKATYGTGSSLMTPVHDPVASRHGLSTTVAWAEPSGCPLRPGRQYHQYRRRGAVAGGFSPAPGGVEEAAGTGRERPRFRRRLPGAGVRGVGRSLLGRRARGLICGLTRGTTAAHVARATIDSIAYQVRDVFEAIRQDADHPDSGAAMPMAAPAATIC